MSVVIPESVKTIGNDAFNGDISLSTISIPDNLQSLGERAFERNFSLTRIEYCGKLVGFPITPTCPPERQAVMDAAAKVAADKVIADKAAADLLAQQKAAASKKPITITCIKGKLTKKVTAVNPKCPSGYKKK